MPDALRSQTRTLIRPRRTPRDSTGWSLGATIDLPPDLLADATRRLRVLALLYAFTFLMVGFVPAFVCAECAAYLFGSSARWMPGVASIVLGLAIFGLTLLRQVPPHVLVAVASLFEIAGSYGIAFAEYQGFSTGITQFDRLGGFGLSWVSLFVVLVAVVVPTSPRRAAVAAALSVTAVPVAFGIALVTGNMALEIRPEEFFFFLVFPYCWVVLIASVGARVVYHLGTQVQRAREMGSYQLEERLGAGGMGEVWRARHRLLARPAAIKLIRPEALGGDERSRRTVLTRFEREAQATAAMRCPHTIELYDFGVADDGAFYYVMELLDGFDIETLVERFGPLPAARAVAVLGQVCHSLAEAHARGLIHRDIKPANVFLCRHGRELDWVKVLDFGMVKTRDERDGDARLTADNAVGGTPAFMAPEQVMGERPVDGRTDLYAVGCLGYWLLTGQLVFAGTSPLEAMMHHVTTAPVPPSRRTEVAIPAELEQLVLQCLEKDPARRPASAEVLMERLAAVPVAEPWTVARARAWWERHAPVAIASGVHDLLPEAS